MDSSIGQDYWLGSAIAPGQVESQVVIVLMVSRWGQRLGFEVRQGLMLSSEIKQGYKLCPEGEQGCRLGFTIR